MAAIGWKMKIRKRKNCNENERNGGKVKESWKKMREWKALNEHSNDNGTTVSSTDSSWTVMSERKAYEKKKQLQNIFLPIKDVYIFNFSFSDFNFIPQPKKIE